MQLHLLVAMLKNRNLLYTVNLLETQSFLNWGYAEMIDPIETHRVLPEPWINPQTERLILYRCLVLGLPSLNCVNLSA